MKRVWALILLVCFIGAITACSSQEESYEEAKPLEAVNDEAGMADGIGSDEVKYGGIQTDRKIIQSAYIVMETLSFDDTVQVIKDNTYAFSGYFENMRIDGKRMDLPDSSQHRVAEFIIRIPKDKFENFINAFEKMGNIVVNELSSEDVTDRYIDTEARLKTLKIQESRLLEILSTATEVEDIIVLEERLSEVRYEIESYTGDIRKWDNLVEFTTVSLRIREVQEITEPEPESLLSQSVETFGDSIVNVIDILKAFVVFLFGFVPYLVILVPVGFAIKALLKLKKKKNIGSFKKKEKRNRKEKQADEE